MNLNEAINRIEFQIKDDLKLGKYTIAGIMDIERIIQAKNDLDTLNKGIDELIEKYEDRVDTLRQDYEISTGILIYDVLNDIIQDLKSLKG